MNPKKFSMSQPQLDSPTKFDIPSPPPVAPNESESYFTLPSESQSVPVITINAQQEATGALTSASDLLDVHRETRKASMSSIPDLQLNDPSSLEEKENIPVHISATNDAKSVALTAPLQTTSAVGAQAALPASQPPVTPHSSAHKAATVSSVCTGNDPHRDIPQQACQKTDSTSVASSHHQPDAADTDDSASLASADTSNYTVVTGPSPAPQDDKPAISADSAASRREVLISHTERSFPETAKFVTTSSAVSSESSADAANQDQVFGALYESLFPQNFASELTSSLLSPSHQLRSDERLLSTTTESVRVKTRYECRTETSALYSRTSTSREFDSAAGEIDASIGEREGSSSTESSRLSFYASQIQTIPENHHRYQAPALSAASKYAAREGIPYSELTRSHSELTSNSQSLVADIVWSVPVCLNSAPPISDYETSRGTDAQVTDCKRRVILVKELVTDEAYPGRSSPVPEKMNVEKDCKIKIGMTDEFSAPSGQMAGNDAFLSPVYLSVGSDDDSTKEIYYSAEEDNADESGEDEMFTMDDREDSVVGLCEEATDGGISRRDEGALRAVIVRVEYEGDNMDSEGKGGNYSSQNEVQQQLEEPKSDSRVKEMETSESLVKRAATAVDPQIKEEGEEGRKEELLAPPVRQANTMMVCNFAPPSSELHGQVEGSRGNWTVDSETKERSKGESPIPSQVEETQVNKDFPSSGHERATSSYPKEEDAIAPITTEPQGHVSLIVDADETGGGSKESREVITDPAGTAEVVMGNVTHSAQLQSDSTEAEHNRVPLSTEWADTITQSPDRNITTPEQVPVEPSASNADTQHLDRGAAEDLSESCEHPQEAQPDPNEG